MPGTVAKVFVKVGQHVKAGDTLVAVESMKMEYNIKATHDAVVSEVLINEGQFVEMRQKLVQFK
jgi:biotin carboxyl carrier protein